MKSGRPARRLYRTMVSGWQGGGGRCWRATRRGIVRRKLIQTMSGGIVQQGQAPIGWIEFQMPKKTQVESGADVNKRSGGSLRTTLIGAAIMGRTSVVRYLLSQGADPDITDKDGNTAAALALAEGHRELAEELYKISPPGTPTKQPKFEHPCTERGEELALASGPSCKFPGFVADINKCAVECISKATGQPYQTTWADSPAPKSRRDLPRCSEEYIRRSKPSQTPGERSQLQRQILREECIQYPETRPAFGGLAG